MTNNVKKELESLKDIIFDSLTEDKFSAEEVVSLCDELIKYLQDEKMGMEDLLEEEK